MPVGGRQEVAKHLLASAPPARLAVNSETYFRISKHQEPEQVEVRLSPIALEEWLPPPGTRQEKRGHLDAEANQVVQGAPRRGNLHVYAAGHLPAISRLPQKKLVGVAVHLHKTERFKGWSHDVFHLGEQTLKLN